LLPSADAPSRSAWERRKFQVTIKKWKGDLFVVALKLMEDNLSTNLKNPLVYIFFLPKRKIPCEMINMWKEWCKCKGEKGWHWR